MKKTYSDKSLTALTLQNIIFPYQLIILNIFIIEFFVKRNNLHKFKTYIFFANEFFIQRKRSIDWKLKMTLRLLFNEFK